MSILKIFILKLNFNDEKEFNEYILSSSNYSLDDIKQKIKIEIAWNELIYFKYKNQINIDKEKLKFKIEQLDNEVIKNINYLKLYLTKKR